MKTTSLTTWAGCVILALAAPPALAEGLLTFTTNSGAITITGYSGSGGEIVIPSATNGWPVTSITNSAFQNNSGITSIIIPDSITHIGPYAFYYCSGLTNVLLPGGLISLSSGMFFGCSALENITIPRNVRTIGSYAFNYCTHLAGVYFTGDAPATDSTVFLNAAASAKLYYLPDTHGWGPSFSSRSTFLWNPTITTTDTSFGVQSNQFGFTITGTTNIPIVVVACSDLGGPWIPLRSASLTNGSFYFGDSAWMNYPARLYRIRSP
jgi:hypothetical protein